MCKLTAYCIFMAKMNGNTPHIGLNIISLFRKHVSLLVNLVLSCLWYRLPPFFFFFVFSPEVPLS